MLLLPLRLDLAPHLGHRLILYFNPRTPVRCAPVQKYSTTVSKFQSTHPSGVRLRRLCTGCRLSDFNPRTPVECDHPPRMWLARHAISIHAPREGCDYQNGDPTDVRTVFQSTRPVRGATEHDADLVVDVVISIHAPREGCDFQPAPSVHERTISIHAPREGCDRPALTARGLRKISIHAPREGCDLAVS